jgi:hypothetical protein
VICVDPGSIDPMYTWRHVRSLIEIYNVFEN